MQHGLRAGHQFGKVYRLSLVVGLAALLTACGGAGGSPSKGNTPSPAPPSLGGGAVAKPVVISVNTGQTTSGTNITVMPPAASPPPNAQVLGVSTLAGSGQAFNTGAIINRGANSRVLLFGPGLNGNMQVTITGPADITVANIETIKATDGTPGVAFAATVSGNAALGCRTVVLQSPGGDVTTFAGGLEVVP